MKKFIALFFVLTLPLITPTANLMGATTAVQYQDGSIHVETGDLGLGAQLRRGMSTTMTDDPTLADLLQPYSSIILNAPHSDIKLFTSLSRLAIMCHPTRGFFVASAQLPIAPVVRLESVNFESTIKRPELFAKEASTDGSFNYSFNCHDVRCRAAMRAASNMNEVLAVLCREKHTRSEDEHVDTYALLNSVIDDLISNFGEDKDGLATLLGQIFLAHATLNPGSLPTIDPSKTVMPTDMTLQYLDAWYLLTLHVTRAGKLKDDEQVATKICMRLRNAVLGMPSSASSATMSDGTPSDDDEPASPEDVAPQLAVAGPPAAPEAEEPAADATTPLAEPEHTQNDKAEEPPNESPSAPGDSTPSAPPKGCCVVM